MATEIPDSEREKIYEENVKKLESLTKQLWLEYYGKEPDKGPIDFSKCKYSTLVYVLENSEEPDEVEACELELDRREEMYEAWKERNLPEEERKRRREERKKRQEEPIIINCSSLTFEDIINDMNGIPYHDWGVFGETEC